MPESTHSRNLTSMVARLPVGGMAQATAPDPGKLPAMLAVVAIGLAALATLHQARVNDPMMRCDAGHRGSLACRSTADADTVRFGADAVQVLAGGRVYVCPGDRMLVQGRPVEVMSEVEANARGFRPAGGKACD